MDVSRNWARTDHLLNAVHTKHTWESLDPIGRDFTQISLFVVLAEPPNSEKISGCTKLQKVALDCLSKMEVLEKVWIYHVRWS